MVFDTFSLGRVELYNASMVFLLPYSKIWPTKIRKLIWQIDRKLSGKPITHLQKSLLEAPQQKKKTKLLINQSVLGQVLEQIFE